MAAIAIDTNIIIALWDREPDISQAAEAALNRALACGALLVAAPVFAELLAGPGRDPAFVDGFFSDSAIAIDWVLDERIWRLAGRAFQDYALRRRPLPAPRRMLADFVIGAHAVVRGCRLLTLDQRHYRAAFPHLPLLPFADPLEDPPKL